MSHWLTNSESGSFCLKGKGEKYVGQVCWVIVVALAKKKICVVVVLVGITMKLSFTV